MKAKKPGWVDWFGLDDTNDIFAGTKGADWARGLSGDDQLSGASGNDLLEGGAGADLLNGGNGNDVLYGDSIAPVVVPPPGGEVAEDPPVVSYDDVLSGGNGKDLLFGQEGNDTLFGGNGIDALSGGVGDDVLDGGNGKDWLDGGEGADVLSGGNAKDVLKGGLGADVLTGGQGADRFVFDALDAVDTITDFRPNLDRIVLDDAMFTGLGVTWKGQLAAGSFSVDPATAPLDQAYIGYDAATGALYYDSDGVIGEVAAVQFAQLDGAPEISAADFAIA